MKNQLSLDWWRFELYRHIAHYLHSPSDITQARLTALINEFRKLSDQHQSIRMMDEHECAMNYY